MSNYTTIKNVAQFLADPSGGLEMCRYADIQFPEPGEFVPQQLHITPASARIALHRPDPGSQTLAFIRRPY